MRVVSSDWLTPRGKGMTSYRVTDLVSGLPATVPFVGPEAQERAQGRVAGADLLRGEDRGLPRFLPVYRRGRRRRIAPRSVLVRRPPRGARLLLHRLRGGGGDPPGPAPDVLLLLRRPEVR